MRTKNNPTDYSQDDLISVEEAAAILKPLKPKTIYNGKGGTEHLLRVKLGGSVALLKSEVLEHRRSLVEEARKQRDLIQYGR